ncbi:biliverdin-producing heme oxygenase [Pseudopedobacter beijingensis]|uniref:Biliverdin-producing heme oxygenase n=1 Tax=Pseudopedobacter beijingensis TaxID=1207056 RepID=A0ABW4IGN4_9SPHI
MLSEKIKEATKQPHQELEKVVVQKLKAIQSEADYIDFLNGFYAYFSSLEKAFQPFITPEVLPDYSTRRTSAYLKKDIEELGGNTDNLSAIVPTITNTQQAIGALYVMEGSIMGGSAIVKMLEKAGITKGVSFFSGYGAETGQKWGMFVGIMNKTAQTEEEQAQAIETAGQTFSLFGNVFTPVNAG